MSTDTPRIESAIREHLAPVLRADGFSGSGKTFRRVVDDWIHVVNVQGSRHGGQFAVNLGVQPMAVPDVLGEMPNPKTVTEALCEFRRRMSERQARQDKWWKHDPTEESMAAAVRDAAATYARVGRKLLGDVTASGADLNTISATAFAEGNFNFLGFGSTECRMALALARLRKSRGQLADSRAFATFALETAGAAAVSLKAQARALLTP